MLKSHAKYQFEIWYKLKKSKKLKWWKKAARLNSITFNTFPAAPKIAISPPLRELAANLLRNDSLKSKKALQEQLYISYTLNISQKSHDIYICHLQKVLRHHPNASLWVINRL